MSRLSTGGLIDRGKPLAFTFDGRPYMGYAGDTLASALLANDVRLVGRSFKYHRPRGILTAGSEEPNALVTVDGAPNTRATTLELTDGLAATSQNRWPSLGFDLLAVNQLFSPLFVAGFYYKTFMWPAAFWEKLYEPLIRRAAGLGALSGQPDETEYDADHAFCDLLVVGAGPAGLAATLAAARDGQRVLLVDEDNRLGGRLLAERHEIGGSSALDWVDSVAAELTSLPNVRILRRTVLFGAYDGGTYGAVERGRTLWKIVAKRSILATGAVERPLVFGGNDIPGVMTASAVQAYVNRWGVAPGKRIAIFTTSDSGRKVAADLRAAGIDPVLIDARDGLHVVRAIGGQALKAIQLSDGRRIPCDTLAMAGGWNPAVGLGCNLGARPNWSDALGAYLLDNPPRGIVMAGAANGRYELGAAMASGVAASGASLDLPSTFDDPADPRPLWHVPGAKGKAFVDYQHDVTDSDVALAAREGFTSVEHMKRYTTLGMATDQGKTGQVTGNALLAAATGRSIAETGTILSRPPYLPISIGVLAGHHRGRHFKPERHTAGHQWAVEQGAVFTDAGQWKRAQWFPQPGERDWLESVIREVTAVRASVGVCDVSTLGKIDVHGPDAGLLLDRLYINGFSNLAIGKARYGVMLREDGFVMDDGTTTRFAEDYFFVTTTTVNAAKVMQHIDYARQVLWPDLDAQATSVTEQWATFAVAGPQSRDLLTRLLPEFDPALPYMGAAAIRWNGIPARVYRLSFSGELAYEISVPATHGDALIRAIHARGAVPYGTEALGVMRIEKGHPAGNELNGQTTAADLGMGRMMSTKKDFIGRAMAARPGLVDPARPALVGLRPVDPAKRLRGGAHLVAAGKATVAANDEGHVTSAAFSPSLGHWIALGLLRNGRDRHGERIVAHDPVRDGDIEVEVCSPVFIDPEGVRVRG